VLQQEFNRYLAGTFDPMLPVTERSTNSKFVLSPQRLYDFLVRTWVPARNLETRQAETFARTSAAMQHLELLEQMKVRINQELSQTATEVQQICATVDEANSSLTELHSAINTVRSDLSYFQRELADLDNPATIKLDEKSQLDYEMKRLEYRSHLQKKAADADRAIHELNEAVPTETERFNRATAALKRLEVKLQEKEAELAEAQNKIRVVRDQILISTGDRAQSILRSATT
jgi:chromosome segregation ATPase